MSGNTLLVMHILKVDYFFSCLPIKSPTRFTFHNFLHKPERSNVQATSLQAANILFINATDHYIIIHYQNPPMAGKDNLLYNILNRPSIKVKYL